MDFGLASPAFTSFTSSPSFTSRGRAHLGADWLNHVFGALTRRAVAVQTPVVHDAFALLPGHDSLRRQVNEHRALVPGPWFWSEREARERGGAGKREKRLKRVKAKVTSTRIAATLRHRTIDLTAPFCEVEGEEE